MSAMKNLVMDILDFYEQVTDDTSRIADFFGITTTEVDEVIKNYHPAGVKNKDVWN